MVITLDSTIPFLNISLGLYFYIGLAFSLINAACGGNDIRESFNKAGLVPTVVGIGMGASVNLVTWPIQMALLIVAGIITLGNSIISWGEDDSDETG